MYNSKSTGRAEKGNLPFFYIFLQNKCMTLTCSAKIRIYSSSPSPKTCWLKYKWVIKSDPVESRKKSLHEKLPWFYIHIFGLWLAAAGLIEQNQHRLCSLKISAASIPNPFLSVAQECFSFASSCLNLLLYSEKCYHSWESHEKHLVQNKAFIIKQSSFSAYLTRRCWLCSPLSSQCLVLHKMQFSQETSQFFFSESLASEFMSQDGQELTTLNYFEIILPKKNWKWCLFKVSNWVARISDHSQNNEES